MILKRLMRYGIIFAAILLVLSIFSIYKHWNVLSAYFANSFASFVGVGFYVLIIGFFIWMMIKSVFR